MGLYLCAPLFSAVNPTALQALSAVYLAAKFSKFNDLTEV
jgi:hypothetical protein